MTNLPDAAAFLAQEWPVFACDAEKRPVTLAGFHDAVTDPDEARSMFRRPGVAMIGVPTGQVSGLAVIDLDVKDGRHGLEWLAANEHRIPRTRRHSTRSGGMHLLFRYPEGRRIGSGVGGKGRFRALPVGVDVRGNGGYIIAPPSPGYAIADACMPAEMPAWLVEMLDPPEVPRQPVQRGPMAPRTAGDGSPYGLAALAKECAEITGAADGQKHWALNKAAYAIGGLVTAGELVEGVAFAALSNALDGIRHRCEDQRAAEKTLRQAFEAGMAQPRQAPPPRSITHTVRYDYGPPPDMPEPPPHDVAPEWVDAEPEPDMPEPEPAAQKADTPALWEDEDEWDEALIPPRPWIARGFILRRAVTIVSGPGGGGKSSLSVAWSTALATGESVGRFKGIDEGVLYRQLVYNVEDERDEQRMRYSAALRSYGLTPAAIRGLITRCGPNDIGTLIRHDAASGKFLFTEAWDALDAMIADKRPDVVWLDPLVELHTAEENDNTALRQVIAYCRALATRHNCAVVLVHHARKGATAGDAEGIRGAGSIVGASRVSLTVIPMTAEEAQELGVPSEFRDLYFRVDGAKSNYARKGAPNWHMMTEYELANGEFVAAVTAWQPGDTPSNAGIDPDRMAIIEAAVRRGTPDGPYSPRLSTQEPRSILPLLLKHGFDGRGAQTAVLNELSKAGFVTRNFRAGGPNRALKVGLQSPEGAPAANWVNQNPGNET